MTGVIDENGQQWEVCNECGEYVRIETLYHSTTKSYPTRKVDACGDCKMDDVGPAIPHSIGRKRDAERVAALRGQYYFE
jgi:hypothetical protein